MLVVLDGWSHVKLMDTNRGEERLTWVLNNLGREREEK